jgi:hypothetical protein
MLPTHKIMTLALALLGGMILSCSPATASTTPPGAPNLCEIAPSLCRDCDETTCEPGGDSGFLCCDAASGWCVGMKPGEPCPGISGWCEDIAWHTTATGSKYAVCEDS